MNVYFATQAEIYSMTTKRQERKKQKSDTGRSKMFVNHRLNTMK